MKTYRQQTEDENTLHGFDKRKVDMKVQQDFADRQAYAHQASASPSKF